MNITTAQFIRSVATAEQLPKDNLPEIAFAGRSNVGKSSLINCLLSRKKLALTSSTPGKTRLLNFYLINQRFYFVDLPGYGYAKVSLTLREEWGNLIESYLTTRPALKGVVVITDARHDVSPMDMQMIEWLAEITIPFLVVATKADKLSKNKLKTQLQKNEKMLTIFDTIPIIPFSTVSKLGKKEILSAIYDLINR